MNKNVPLWIYGLAGGIGIVISHLLLINLLDITGVMVYVMDFIVILLCILGFSFMYQKWGRR